MKCNFLSGLKIWFLTSIHITFKTIKKNIIYLNFQFFFFFFFESNFNVFDSTYNTSATFIDSVTKTKVCKKDKERII